MSRSDYEEYAAMQTDLFGEAEPDFETGTDISVAPSLETLFGLQPDGELTDGGARFEAISPFESFIVQAPAGSGKTALLTQRFLALLSQVDQPEKIVAMTFTKKAAAEMRERIIGALKLGQKTALAEDASLYEINTWKLARKALLRDSEQAWSLLENPNRLRIKTIDGMNGFLVGQMPLLSKMGAQPQVSQNADPHYLEAARLALKDPNCNEAMASLLRLVNGRYNRAEALLVNMLKKRDQWMGSLLSMQGEKAREILEQALSLIVEQELETQLAHLKAVMPLLREACELADFAVQNDQEGLQPLCGWNLKGDIEDLEKWRILADWIVTKDNKSVRKTVDKRSGFPAGKGEAKDNKDRFLNALAGLREAPQSQQILQSLVVLKGLPDPRYTQDQWDNLQWLIQLLTMAAGYLKVVFRSQGQADFIEVAQAASQALGTELEPTELAQQLDYQIHHLLVDEFQDTSSEQYALISKLVAGWQPGDGRTLFIVGDPMQSIYRFREAEVGNFLKAWQGKIGEVSLTPLNLVVNFRSSRSVVEWVNQTFHKVFPKQDNIETGAVRYSHAEAFSERNDVAVYTHWNLNQSAESEAVEAVQFIKQRLAELQDQPDKKIALLGRTRSSLMVIASLLKQQGIGFRAVELESLQARQEIQDCLALSRALLHLADRPAWIALLRSPLVGLSLNDLHALLGGDFYRPVWDLIQTDRWSDNSLSEIGQQRLQSVLPVLQEAIRRLGSLPFSVVVRECWLQLDGAQTVENATALDNVEVFWQTLAQVDSEELNAKKLDDLIETLYASPDASPQSQQIELMTMHKSKGLEFDTVILPGLGRKPRANDKELVSWLQFLGPDVEVSGAMREWLVIAPLDQRGQGDSLLAGLLKRFEQEKADYELARLLYVAATRAKTQLHLFGSLSYKISEKSDKVITPVKGSLLEPLWCCVGSEFEQMAAAYDEEETMLEVEPILPKVSRLPMDRNRLSEQLDFQPFKAESATLETAVESISDAILEPEEVTAERYSEVGSDQALLNTSVGNLVHAVFELMAQDDVRQWSQAELEACSDFYLQWLKQEGLQGELLQEAHRRVMKSLNNGLANDKVCWALQADHLESQTEYPLTSLEEEAVANHIVDRTFVDEAGTRWIVDYKTSFFEGDADKIEAFIEKQVAHYEPQLARYGRLFDVLDATQPNGVKAQKWVLYFSYLDRWVELN
ncbi:UvrD-helicase domain-containing protein [Thiomicrorhabdus sp. ZW0627]|uniref:UvrD-helicase domain-containing protein n=1 Tax=Thiomicrorhabdus sp. ZW0627 TaxID=3039774 RepID=UPI0024371BB7|nr:UvrD-helicase domain-containing protein [Thiomicrorhabdus sp. ZW0627]MDG6773993.1 UvrD-helicase domain-containing protein [Thiomicrorhabdus sp. ZW0627]